MLANITEKGRDMHWIIQSAIATDKSSEHENCRR